MGASERGGGGEAGGGERGSKREARNTLETGRGSGSCPEARVQGWRVNGKVEKRGGGELDRKQAGVAAGASQ